METIKSLAMYTLLVVLVQKVNAIFYIRKITKQLTHIRKNGKTYTNFYRSKGLKRYYIIEFDEDIIHHIYVLKGFFISSQFNKLEAFSNIKYKEATQKLEMITINHKLKDGIQEGLVFIQETIQKETINGTDYYEKL